MANRIEDDPVLAEYLRTVGEQIRVAREAGELSQAEVGEIFGWNRDMISKIERGLINIYLHDYLRIVWFLHEVWSPKNDPIITVARRAVGWRG